MQIKYEPHPVTPERKKEILAQGYRIIDAKFEPKSDRATRVEVPKRRKRKPPESSEQGVEI